MRIAVAFAITALVLASADFASFTYLYSFNGSNADDSTSYFEMGRPSGLLYAGGYLYVADNDRNAFYVMNGTRRERMAGTAGGAGIALTSPMRIASDGSRIFVADGLSGKLVAYNFLTRQMDEWNSASNLKQASGVAFDSEYAYITDMVDGRVYAFSLKHKAYDHIVVEKGETDGMLLQPADIEYYQGKYFVTDKAKGLVNVYDQNFSFLYAFGRGRGDITLNGPHGIEVHNDRIYVADTNAQRVVAFTLDGYPVQVLDSKVGGTNFSYPQDIALDGSTLYVADTENGRISVFSINESGGNDSVRQLLSAANESLSRLDSIQSVAKKLGVEFNITNGAGSLAAAQVDYSQYAFSSAASLAQQVIDSSAAQQSSLSQKIELKIRQALKAEKDKVAPYRQVTQPDLVAKLSQIDNTFADIEAKLAAKSYNLAADAVLGLPLLTDKFEAEGKKAAMSGQERARAEAAGGMQVEIEALTAKIGRLKEKAAAYRQELNLTNTEGMVASAKDYLAAEDYGAANRSLELAITEVASYDAAIAAASSEIDAALANITVMEFTFNSSAAKPALLPADISPERKAFADARNAAYSNSQLAIAMAKQALEAGEAKLKGAQTMSVAVAALLVLFGMAALIAVMFFLHLRHRKRSGHSHRQENGKPPAQQDAGQDLQSGQQAQGAGKGRQGR